MSIRLLFILFFIPSVCFAGHLHKEKEYQNAWCSMMGGITEVVLDDGTRVDCLLDDYAVEVDFAPKWAESIGQSLYYALKTGRQPGVLLILEKEGDERYLARLQFLADYYHLRTWTTTPNSISIDDSIERSLNEKF